MNEMPSGMESARSQPYLNNMNMNKKKKNNTNNSFSFFSMNLNKDPAIQSSMFAFSDTDRFGL
jgi:hypothetical protein